MRKTGIVKDKRYMDHDMGALHPESPKRLEVIYAMLESPDMQGNFITVPVRRALEHELHLVHSPKHVQKIAATEGQTSAYLDPDTQTSAGSYEAALLAVGGLCEAISMVNSGELDNAFALVRPPGHHAEKSRAMGFCLFNNVAVGARYSQEYLKLDRVLIIDWDLHHGNGTQHSFEDDPSILYFSTHQYPFYPGSGAFTETGTGRGEGFTVNVPLSPGCGDGDYIAIFEHILRPIALDFNPDIILVSAGFDTHTADPLGGMMVTPKGFAGMARSIMKIADSCCKGKIIITLEGGYDVEGQKDSVKEVLKEMAGLPDTDIADMMADADKKRFNLIFEQVKKTHHKNWNNL